ncbi:GAF domain-containing protein [Actinoplanes oblitus]|uniref:GAF domain-containing protein n=1 Tax=Actinoplanes oblitus TaxID=3040509 RepID=A0ABY8W846_9ACTN|nr:GAF domain-containing protein [Actinoplanes oblitus]WIM92564.1 GAF domain-containing protein [Actinoplanes oblitus]
MSDSEPTAASSDDVRDSLAGAVVSLAETPDDEPAVDALLVEIATSAAETIAGVFYASITAWRGAGYTTVAASSDLARAVDDAQHAEQAGPCVQAARTGQPVGVPEIAATMAWPGFYRQATELGLRTSVSVPLFAGGGIPVGVLNLYGREPSALAGLLAGVHAVFAAEQVPESGLEACDDAGARQLLVGLGRALQVRVTIQRALGALMAWDGGDAAEARRMLRERAAARNATLSTTATEVLATVMPVPGAGVHVTTRPPIGATMVVALNGELAAPLAIDVPTRLTALLDEPVTTLELDLTGLRFCDLTGLRVLLDLREHATVTGRTVSVVAASGVVRMLMQITDTASLLGYPPASPGVNGVPG